MSIIASLILAWAVDRYRQRGYGVIFGGVWTVAGLIAIYTLPGSAAGHNWNFYAALVVTQSAPSWQPLNITWLAENLRTPQQRSIALAFYMGASNLGTVYGGQILRKNDAPLYRRGWAACLSLGASFLALSIFQRFNYGVSNRIKEREWNGLDEKEQAEYLRKEEELSERGVPKTNKSLRYRFTV